MGVTKLAGEHSAPEKAEESIERLLRESNDDPWAAWRRSAVDRVEGVYKDKAAARVEHYLLRFAIGRDRLDGLADEINRFDQNYYQTLIRPLKCLVGMSTRDKSLVEWERRGYDDGDRHRKALKQIGARLAGEKTESEARRFLLETTNEVVQLLAGSGALRARNRFVYSWMRLLRWHQCRSEGQASR